VRIQASGARAAQPVIISLAPGAELAAVEAHLARLGSKVDHDIGFGWVGQGRLKERMPARQEPVLSGLAGASPPLERRRIPFSRLAAPGPAPLRAARHACGATNCWSDYPFVTPCGHV
jgi:hypothetical protein